MDYIRIDQANQYKVYPQRFVVTSLFGLIQMMTSVLMNTLNPIAKVLVYVYDLPTVVVTLGGLLYILMHPLFTFPAAYVIDSKGMKVGIRLGSILGVIGITLRLFVNYSFLSVVFGQVLAGIGRPFILNCQAKVSANWFRAGQRGGITQLLTLVLNVSLIIGILIPGLIFSGYKPSPQTKQVGKQLTFKLMLVEAIMGYICFIPNIFFQIQKPPTPPSQSGDMVRQPFNQAMKKVFKNKNFILLLFAFGLYFGLFNAISITLSFILAPWFGNNSVVVTAVGGAPVISGILGVMLIGPFQRKSKKFKKWILICMLGSCSAMIIFYPILELHNVAAACFVSAYNSFFLIPLVPIMLQLACQLVFPVGEGTAVGLLFAFGNLFGFLLGLAMTKLIDGVTKVGTLKGIIFCFSLFVIGLIMIILMKQQKNREKAEQEKYLDRMKLQNSLIVSQSNFEGKQYVPAINQGKQYIPTIN